LFRMFRTLASEIFVEVVTGAARIFYTSPGLASF
jgi:hypothetical protein